MKNSGLLIGAICATFIVGCGKAPDTASTRPSVVVDADKNEPALARGDLQSPDNYVAVTMGKVNGEAMAANGQRMRSMFWAGAPIEYDALAEDFIPQYRDEKDAFKRADIVKANKPLLEKEYSAAQQTKRYSIRFDQEGADYVSSYDASAKGFKVERGDTRDDIVWQWRKPEGKTGDYAGFWGVKLIGSSGFIYKPETEETARKIESTISSLRGNGNSARLPTVFYGRIVGYDKKQFEQDKKRAVVFFLVDGVSVEDPRSGQVIFTADQRALGKNALLESKDVISYFSNNK